MQQLSSGDPHDPDYRRLRYVRYADDFVLGFIGPKAEAEQIKESLATFLCESLKLELSGEKNSSSTPSRFTTTACWIFSPRLCWSPTLQTLTATAAFCSRLSD